MLTAERLELGVLSALAEVSGFLKNDLHIKRTVLCFWCSLWCIKIWIVIYYRGLKFPHRAVVLLLLENNGACTGLNGHSAVKPKVWQRPSHGVETNCIIYYIQCIHNSISLVIYIYIYIYICTYIHTHTHSDHIMATCFDRKTFVIRPIENIFKVQRSEHSMAFHFVYSKS